MQNPQDVLEGDSKWHRAGGEGHCLQRGTVHRGWHVLRIEGSGMRVQGFQGGLVPSPLNMLALLPKATDSIWVLISKLPVLKCVYVNLFKVLSPAQWCIWYMRSFDFISHLLFFIFKFRMCDFTLRVLRTGVKWGQSHTSWRHCYLNWHSQRQFWIHPGARPHVPASTGLAAGDYTLGSSILPCQPCACLFLGSAVEAPSCWAH